jgi:flagellar assembly factor FliW
LEIPASRLIQLPSWFVGFERPQMFALFDYNSSFYWLQNIDDSELGFTLSYGLALFKEFEMHPLFGYSDSDPKA